MGEPPQIGRPPKYGLSPKWLGINEYKRRLWRIKHPKIIKDRWTGLSKKKLGGKNYMRAYRLMTKTKP